QGAAPGQPGAARRALHGADLPAGVRDADPLLRRVRAVVSRCPAGAAPEPRAAAAVRPGPGADARRHDPADDGRLARAGADRAERHRPGPGLPAQLPRLLDQLPAAAVV